MKWSMLILIGLSLGPLFGAEVKPASKEDDKGCPTPHRAKLQNELTNEGIALLARAGYSESFLIDLIYQKPTRFDVSAEGLAWLADRGISERIVRVMIAAASLENVLTALPAAKWYLVPESPPAK
jgi:hypothetical protein